MSSMSSAAPQQSGQRRRRRRRSSLREFERRFLSEKYRGGAGTLEIAMIWRDRVTSVEQYDKAEPISIGRGGKNTEASKKLKDEDVTYLVENDSIGDSFELFSAQASGQKVNWTLNLSAMMEGFILVDQPVKGQVKFDLKEAVAAGVAQSKGDGYSITIEGGTRAKVMVGEVVFLVHYVSSTPLVLVKSRSDADRMILISMLAAFTLILGLGLVVYFYPERTTELNLSQSLEDGRLKSVYQRVKEEEKKKKAKKKEKEKKKKAKEKVKEKTKKVVVKKDNKPKVTNPSPDSKNTGEGPPSNNPTDIENYNTVVTAGALSSADQLSALSNLGVSANTEGALGGLKGFSAASGGSRAYAISQSGSGVGGGGTGGGGMGGGSGVGGATGGKGSGKSVGGGGDGLRERSTKTPKLKPGRFQSSGNFDKKIIKRVVSRNKKAITNCYEKQLRKKPNLKGRITISWRIGAAGTVGMVKVKSNEMGDSAVAKCLMSRIKGWKFPAPSGGGAVDVAYPFNFDAQ